MYLSSALGPLAEGGSFVFLLSRYLPTFGDKKEYCRPSGRYAFFVKGCFACFPIPPVWAFWPCEGGGFVGKVSGSVC